MGGEPTLVSIYDMGGEEWNTAALGPEKELRASKLIRRLRDEIAPKGLLHCGQGKWYPGESLPRWAFTCYWRSDRSQLWRDDQWIANPEKNYGFGTTEAQSFDERLADYLSIDRDYVISAYKDPLKYVLKERMLPVNLDPKDSKLEDPEERERFRRVFERGLDQPSGFVLSVQRVYGLDGQKWQSGLWMLRGRHLYLVPGDSPIGLRLPLQSLPYFPASQLRYIYEIDPMSLRDPLPVPQRLIPK